MSARKHVRVYTASERARIEARILDLLASGPASAAALAARMKMAPRRLGGFISDLRKKQQIAIYGRDRNDRVWRLLAVPAPPVTLGVIKTEQRENWHIDEEHKQWMAYWQTPRAERRRAMEDGS